MATLTKLESKLAEVLGLATAAQDAVRQVRGMLGAEHEALGKRLAQARDDARETQTRCTDVAGGFRGKKTAILDQAKETRSEAAKMRDAYLAGEDDPLDGFEFLAMTESGEVVHWAILAKLNEQAAIDEVRERGRDRLARSARPWLPRDVVGLPRGRPAPGRAPSRVRGRPAGVRRLQPCGRRVRQRDAGRGPARLIEHLGLGPVHLTAQDISGTTAYRLAATHPEALRSFTAIEAGLAGFGLEALADVTHGGAWHIGVLAAPGIPELLLAGRERELLAGYAFPALTATPGAITDADLDTFVAAYAQPDGFRGAAGLYASLLREGAEIRELSAQAGPLRMPVMAIGAGGGAFTATTMRQVAADVREVQLDGVGHYVALEAPEALAAALLDFWAD